MTRSDDANQSARFRGALVKSPCTRGSFWDRVDITQEQIHLRPWLRRQVLIDRERIEVVEFERDWRPFTWATNVRFRFTDGTTAPKVFIPARTRALRTTLETLGWPTRDR